MHSGRNAGANQEHVLTLISQRFDDETCRLQAGAER